MRAVREMCAQKIACARGVKVASLRLEFQSCMPARDCAAMRCVYVYFRFHLRFIGVFYACTSFLNCLPSRAMMTYPRSALLTGVVLCVLSVAAPTTAGPFIAGEFG